MPRTPPDFNSDRISEAIRHVAMGFGAFSVWSTTPDGTCKCPKGRDCTSAGKHPIPRDGFNAMSRDPRVVETMLAAGSEPNYGLVWPDGTDVVVILDVDGPDWKQRTDELAAKYGPLPRTKTTRTPSGGLHLFYRWPLGIPIPDTNHLHGFVIRFPMKGYVVGPGSAINGKVYRDIGNADIAVLPEPWAQPPRETPLIVVAGDDGGYELPDRVITGTRHDEIARFVASRWNRGISKEEIAAAVVAVLVPRFDEPMDAKRLTDEIDHAWDTAAKKWVEPAASDTIAVGSGVGSSPETEIVIDPLSIESRIERPEPMDPHAVPVPMGLALLLDHYRPITDAPWSSLMLASCVTASALFGTAPTLRWRGSHRPSLFGVLVGASGYGRKGATMRVVERAWTQVDSLLPEITTGGIASGEVLVDILNEAKTNSLGTVLIHEHEIASVLISASREGSILSQNLRKAWDGDKVDSRSRAKGRSSAFGYNAAFLGGVTPSELGKHLTANDIANGWANRFLWFHSERRDGGFDPAADDVLAVSDRDYLRDCIQHARTLGGSMLIKPLYTMTLSPEATARMEHVAHLLDRPPVGSIDALRQRMPGHVIRLAMVAALLDMTAVVELEHVTFGEAMAAYAVDSMRAVFGVRVDDPVAMLILSVLAQVPDGWMNTTDLKKVTGKDYPRTMTALGVLLRENLIEREVRPTKGRPAIGYGLRTLSGGL